MIGLLNGVVAALGDDAALIEVGGVGYVVQAGARTLARLAPGAPARLHIETHVREDAIKLFGFASESERAWFAHVQTIPGVGARVALAILDVLSPDELADAVALQDKAAVSRANGVGPKLAARIVQELAGKPGPRGFASLGGATLRTATPAANANAATSGARAEALSALVNLGIDQISAARAVAAAMKQTAPEAEASEIIRAALKEVSR